MDNRLILVQYDNGDLKVGARSDIEKELNHYEVTGLELPFRTIAKINEQDEIDWLTPKYLTITVGEELLNEAKKAIKNYKTYGWY